MLSLLVKFAAAAHVATEAPEWMQALVPQAAAAQVLPALRAYTSTVDECVIFRAH